MDYYTICAQRTLLSREITGQRIESIRLKGKNLYLGFSDDKAVKLACVPEMPYLLLIERRYMPVRNVQNWYPTRFSGRTLTDVSLSRGDRVLTFHLDSGARLVFEITGRHTNLILVDSEGIIDGALRKVTSKESGYREIRPGIPYIPPPRHEFPDPLWAPLPALERRMKEKDMDTIEALATSVCSGSRLCAVESLVRTGIDTGLKAMELDSDDVFRLLKTVAEMVYRIEKGGDGGTVVYGDDGLPKDVFPLKMAAADPEDVYVDDLNEAVHKYSREREIGLEKRDLKKIISAALSREEKTIRSTVKKIEQERGTHSEPELLEKKGNTILAHLHLIQKGMSTVTLPDPYGTGDVTIDIDKTMDGYSNAHRYFIRARKLRAASLMAEERMTSMSRRLDSIQGERERIETLDDSKELKRIASIYARKVKRTPDIDQPFPRRFVSVSGLEIIVGRNDRENDELIRWAGKNDLWLHAQGVGGSHVILRSPGKKLQPDHKSIEQAASIAAYYSRSRTSAVVPVVCTPVKYVVKRKGQGPGQVTYTREKVIFVEPGLPKGKKNPDSNL